MTSTLKKWPILCLLEPEFTSKIRMVLVYGHSGNSCVIVTKDQVVYSLGNNCEKFLVCPTKIDSLCGKNIITFAYNNTPFVVALTEDGEVYSLKLCNYDVRRCSIQQDVKVHKTNVFVDIACRNDYYITLTNYGDVYIWEYETLNGKIVKVEETNDPPIQFRSISCGSLHSMAVTCHGQVYGWGSNLYWQLGRHSQDMFKVYKVEELTGIVIEKVVCGCNHTLALSVEGFLYSWGDNSFGQLGHSMLETKSQIARKIPFDVKVLDIAASNSSNISVAVGMGQLIFIWGQCLENKIMCPTLISVDSIHDAFALYASSGSMHQPFVIDDEEKKEEDDVDIEETMNIMDHLMAAFDEKNTSDLTIEVQGKPIYVHKAILKIRSEYFKTMFQGNWMENNDSVIRESEFSYVVYRTFLKFLYTGEIDRCITAENAIELLQLADLCNDDHLKGSYEDILIGNISTANVAFFYNAAVLHNVTMLKKRCIEFAATHMAEVTKSTSFSKLTQETMRNFIIEVADHGVFEISV